MSYNPGAETTLGPRMREGDLSYSAQRILRRHASSPSSFPRLVTPKHSEGGKRESSVFPYLAAVLLLCTAPAYAEEWTSLENATGPELFAEKCGMCHRATGMGTGILGRRLSPELALLENREDLQPEFIANVVRAGFGVMFPISRAEVSDAQLQDITAYLTRNNRGASTR
jgi:mono/diheme cytochrome c family protein